MRVVQWGYIWGDHPLAPLVLQPTSRYKRSTTFTPHKAPAMRAEIEAVTTDLKQSLELLRRHL